MSEKTETKFSYTDKCREISGFGGGYESACRDMVIAGMEWLDENSWDGFTSDTTIEFKTYKNIFGMTFDESEDCKKMQNAMSAANDGCSGAQMQAAMSHVMFAHTNGWKKYIEEMEKKK